MKKTIFCRIREAGYVVNRKVVEYIASRSDAEAFLDDILKRIPEGTQRLTMETIMALEKGDGEEGKEAESNEVVDEGDGEEPTEGLQNGAGDENRPTKVRVTGTLDPLLKIVDDYKDEVKVMRNFTDEINTRPEVEGFLKYFLARFEALKSILIENNRELRNRNVSISVVKNRSTMDRSECYIVGMVRDVRQSSKTPTKIMVLEDTEDTIRVIISKKKPELIDLPIMEDIVIGVKGVLSRDSSGKDVVMFASDIYFPDIPKSNIKRVKAITTAGGGKVGLKVAFISDTHVGSNTFLKRSWGRFVDMLNGRGITDARTEEVNKTLGYIVIAGDVVDGIGIYPNQKEELEIADIYGQYEALGRLLEEVPPHIGVIIIPGNHDAVRPSEPQPALGREICSYLPSNTRCVSNPAWLSLNGTKALLYHGRGIDDLASGRFRLGYEDVLDIMKVMLKCRHLAPIYGKKTALAPEPRDALAIDTVPDILVTGHVHKFGLDNYRGVHLVNASTWQDQTSYQKGMNFVPDPGRVAVFDIASKRFTTMNFHAG